MAANRLEALSAGDYQPYWLAVFNHQMGFPPVEIYRELLQRVFCWSSTYPGCGKKGGVLRGAGQFALHNGTDAISLSFRDPHSARPPAIHEAAPSGCTVRGMQAVVEQGSGHLRLVLRCRAVRDGAAVRVRLAKPLRRSFRLHHGNGSIRVRLAKPPGPAEPLSYLDYGQANKSCSVVRSQVRDHSRTFDLRVEARWAAAPATGWHISTSVGCSNSRLRGHVARRKRWHNK